jgi:hypothetical protein
MLDIAERVARKKLTSHNEQVDAAAENFPAIAASKKYYRVEAPGEYKKLQPELKEGQRVFNQTTKKYERVIGGKLVPE